MNNQLTYNLTPLQQGMLFHYISDPNSRTDIDQIVCHLEETIDTEILQKAWDEVILMHDSCRASFVWEDVDQPVQTITPNLTVPIEYFNWSSVDKEVLSENIKSFLKKDRQKGFVLSRAPLIRLNLIKAEDSDFYLIWTFHHILMDGRSHAIILNDVFSLYDSYCSGYKPKIGQLLPFRNFVDWLSKKDLKTSEDFWRKFLKGVNSPTNLLLKSIEHSDEEFSVPNEIELSLDEKISTILRDKAKQHEITLNTIIQGAWGFLLSNYCSGNDIIFGAARACRYSTIDGADSIVGLFMNVLPMRIKVEYNAELIPWLKSIRKQQMEVRKHEHTPLSNVLGWCNVPRGIQLFDTILIFDNYDLTLKLQEKGGKWLNREFRLFEKTIYPVAVYVYADKKIKIKIAYHSEKYTESDMKLMLTRFGNILTGFANDDYKKLSNIPILTQAELDKITNVWNQTKTEFPSDKLIYQLFEQQVDKSPDAIALICNHNVITYSGLNSKANIIANKLLKLGVKPETLVGILVERSIDMVAAILGILKAGGAYVPLDPDFPAERISYMIQDSGCPVIISQQSLLNLAGNTSAKLLIIDSDSEIISDSIIQNPDIKCDSSGLCYVIYTSGSTGKPKGVMIQHRNVVNFFTGMDQYIEHDPPGTWMAVTSLSFDISVLELLYTLCRGFKVVINSEHEWKTRNSRSADILPDGKMDFGLFYFSSYANEKGSDNYRILIEGAKFADENGFSSVWTPERHFHEFGGLYANPAITSAALSTITKNLRIMSGSVVAPLHNPIRIAEDWSMIDNLSNGRIGISFASGWQPNDFSLMPQNYKRRKEIMFEQIETVRKLWSGDAVEVNSPKGEKISIKTLPKPVQKELPVWITAAGNPETFRLAGEKGYNILTHLLGQTIEEVKSKINIYRNAWKENNHQGNGYVSLMIHTYIGEDFEMVKEIVRDPMKKYLASAMSLVELASWYFPVHKDQDEDLSEAGANLSNEDKETILNYAFERYFETSSLFGTPETCITTIERARAAGVDEIACLIDFGVDQEMVLAGLDHIKTLKNSLPNLVASAKTTEPQTSSAIADLIMQHNVTHFQCTPSMARMLLLDDKFSEAIKKLDCLLIGGEAFPVNLAKQLLALTRGKLLNMYGPTETTVWSSVYPINEVENIVPIGRPIANTEIYLLDNSQQLVPIGIAGELCIAGEGLAKGYFNNLELTSEKFVEVPIKGINKKVYRTGDLARYFNNDIIEFIGRIDNQVKIRGYRIEPGEIEKYIEEHPLIREAVVIVHEDIKDNPQLVAYLIAENNNKPSNTVLRDYLLKKLPEYMIPAVFMFLDKLPTTPNGKIDRKALPAPVIERPDIQKDFVMPKTETEKTVSAIWSDVTGVKKIGMNDNFFELGGHSLSAVQAIVKINQAFKIELSMTAFFQASDFKQLVIEIEKILLQQTDDASLEKLIEEVKKISD